MTIPSFLLHPSEHFFSLFIYFLKNFDPNTNINWTLEAAPYTIKQMKKSCRTCVLLAATAHSKQLKCSTKTKTPSGCTSNRKTTNSNIKKKYVNNSEKYVERSKSPFIHCIYFISTNCSNSPRWSHKIVTLSISIQNELLLHRKEQFH